MKKTLELKTMTFEIGSPEKSLHNQSPPRKANSSMHNSPSERFVKGGPVIRKIMTAKNCKRFPRNVQATPQCQNSSSPPRQLTKSQNRYQPVAQQNLQKSTGTFAITSTQHEQQQGQFLGLRRSFNQSKSNVNWSEIMEQRKGRIKSEPNTSVSMKEQIKRRVEKKIQFMKKMTVEHGQSPFLVKGQPTNTETPSKIFNFDRLYEHCLKKLNRGLHYYQKDTFRSKDRKYYEMKTQSNILTSQLKSMRRSMLKKKDSEQKHLGVIGNVIDVNKTQKNEKINSQRNCCTRVSNSTYKKKLGKIAKTIDGKNPFVGLELHGWEIRYDRTDEFQL